MAPPNLLTLTTLLSLLLLSPPVRATFDDTSIQLVTDALDWPSASAMSLYDADQLDDDVGEVSPDGSGAIGRRSLFWRSILRYYISYGALSANRIPCPPRSGRSYYTHNCYTARGPVHPYTRGCSTITRCRR
ncbi:hypothetical protein Vadar_031339 [Vaccinium darrowii]|uniref:Uncharacterized protein n=1 Tax=Vaccinium darrowii TaxID=229202 RepID=A0ACB7YHP9_9ERIC|nr:hypothetical protein Vadar_031339 [Vaccinium darrowii]